MSKASLWNADFDAILEERFGVSPDRLRELAQADKEGRCVVLPVKPGGMVRLKENLSLTPDKVDCINIYADGRITFSFHECGIKARFVDEWSEDESEKYIPAPEAALGREQDE